MHKIFVLQLVYFMPLHVSSKCTHHKEVKLHYTGSAIITPIGVMIAEAV